MSQERFRTLAESLAIAILKGEWEAVWPLVDSLIEVREGNLSAQVHDYRTKRHPLSEGFVAYRTPEFQALCKAWGIMWDVFTIEIVITIPSDGPVIVDQKYQTAQEAPRDG